MIARKIKQTIKAFSAAGITASLLSACMSPSEMDALNSSLDLGDASGPTVPAPPVAPSCFNERFVQAQAEISRSIDILFVMDTSGSMDDNRAKVADGISAFVAELPPQVDYQVGVMLAHGSKSNWSGNLFSYHSTKIFSSKTMTLDSIKSQLKTMVLNAPKDANNEQGEEGSYSLMKGLSTNFQTNQQSGFFRSNAALAVVFVSDENDICAPYTGYPTMPGLTSSEKTIRNRDCKNGISSGEIIAQVKSVQGDRPYLFGAVVHQEESYKDSKSNDGYGFGYMEIVQASHGVSTEINNGDYTQGLSEMGKLATSKLNLLLDFTLARLEVNASTLQVQVDGTNTDFTYDSSSNDVHLSNGGGAMSVIDINYCLNNKQPQPEPSSSPSPEPEPEPTFTPPPSV